MVLGRPLRRYGKVAGRCKFICVLPMLKAKSKVVKKYERISVFPGKKLPERFYAVENDGIGNMWQKILQHSEKKRIL